MSYSGKEDMYQKSNYELKAGGEGGGGVNSNGLVWGYPGVTQH